ncbi:hypothetical protein PUNSTDRAFT_76432, partial [Punctularia strigosozonata HHB-11173 SS5]
EFLRNFWQRQVDTAENETPDYRHPALPLARIKKVMKSGPEVKCVHQQNTLIFTNNCLLSLSEITARAFIVADSNKRRTLSQQDIAKALAKSDQFDFHIDIVPRDDGHGHAAGQGGSAGQGFDQAARKKRKEVRRGWSGPDGS